MKLFNDYDLYLAAQAAGERNIRFERVTTDEPEFVYYGEHNDSVMDGYASLRPGECGA